MPSPFPGMDPFIQGQIWLDFHNSFCIGLRNALAPKLLPRYVIQVDERLVLETDAEPAVYFPDVAVKESSPTPLGTAGEPVGGIALEPVVLTRKRFEPAREVVLQVLDRNSRRVITVIELLSPWNKAPRGYEEYLLKRDDLLDAGINLLEIDLVRGGRRLPTVELLPRGDHFAFVSRGEEPGKVSVYAWRLRDPLPTLPVPLRIDDSHVTVALQPVFDRVYDESGYAHLLVYDVEPEPPLSESDAAWVAERLRQRTSAR
ncbi:MAG TPA: DUF4058 family protein [Planctomycetaceae bacterium]